MFSSGNVLMSNKKRRKEEKDGGKEGGEVPYNSVELFRSQFSESWLNLEGGLVYICMLLFRTCRILF